MKILAASDIHNDTKLVKQLAKQAEEEKVDLVVLCGDITTLDYTPKDLISPFIKKNKKVLLIPGNHETLATVDFLAELYDITNLHGYSIKFKDIGLFGCGSANIGINQLSENEIYEVLKKGFDKIKDTKKKIMITHAHPKGALIENFTNIFTGSIGIRKALDKFKPDILLCGHVHEAEGIEEKIGKTRVINVGRSGKIIEI